MQNPTFPSYDLVIAGGDQMTEEPADVNVVSGKEFSVDMVDNPNLVRVHHDLKITRIGKVLPTDDKPLGGLTTTDLHFDKSEYPKPAAPEDKDVTDQVIFGGNIQNAVKDPEHLEGEDDHEAGILTEENATVIREPKQRKKK